MSEIWKSIPGYPGYEASSLGRVRSIDRMIHGNRLGVSFTKKLTGAVLKLNLKKSGYVCVEIGGVTVLVHRIVFSAFFGVIPIKMEINHKNAKKDDNAISNLELCSSAENKRHAKKNSLQKFTCAGKKMLTPEERRTIKFFYKYERGVGSSISKILSKIYGVHQRTIREIVKRPYE